MAEMQEIKLIADYRNFILHKIDNLQETLDTVTTAFAGDLVNSFTEFSSRINSKLRVIDEKFTKNKEELEQVRSELKSKQFDEANFNNVSMLRNFANQVKERDDKIRELEHRIKYLEANGNSVAIKKSNSISAVEPIANAVETVVPAPAQESAPVVEPPVSVSVSIKTNKTSAITSKSKSGTKTKVPVPVPVPVPEPVVQSQNDEEEEATVIVKKPRSKTNKTKTEPVPEVANVAIESNASVAVESVKKKAPKKAIKKPVAVEEEDDVPVAQSNESINETSATNLEVTPETMTVDSDNAEKDNVDDVDDVKEDDTAKIEAEEELMMAEEAARQAEEELRRQEEDAKKEKDKKTTVISKKITTTATTKPTQATTTSTIIKKKPEIKVDVKGEPKIEIKKKDSKDSKDSKEKDKKQPVKVGYPDKLPDLSELEVITIGDNNYYLDTVGKYVYQILPDEEPGILLGVYSDENNMIDTIDA